MKRRLATAALSALGMLMLILDSKTALSGAADGVALCIRVAVPSLLPFFVLSMMLTSSLSGTSSKFFRPIGRLCGIPAGSESLLLVGFLGGYPAGAQNVTNAWKEGLISKETAQRMLGFCSNAGPAFIFGIVAVQFDGWWIPWALWGIHIASSLAVGAVLPGKEMGAVARKAAPISIQTALKRSLSVMATVCGWIILFRVLMAFLDRWVLFFLSENARTLVMGALELTIGCTELSAIGNVGLRFVTVSGFLAFGGLCVTMQTVSATEKLGLGAYLPGKLLQTVISIALAFAVQFAFPAVERMEIPPAFMAMLPVLLAVFAIWLRESEKRGRIPGPVGV